jgi:hypothetical protein
MTAVRQTSAAEHLDAGIVVHLRYLDASSLKSVGENAGSTQAGGLQE